MSKFKELLVLSIRSDIKLITSSFETEFLKNSLDILEFFF